MNVHNAKRIEAGNFPSGRADGRRHLARALFGVLLAALALGCGASFSKNDALTDDDIKNARGEAENRIKAGQRLQILRSQMHAPAASASAPVAAPPAAPPAEPEAPAPAPTSAPPPAPVEPPTPTPTP